MSDSNPFSRESEANPYGPTQSVSARYAEGQIRLPDGQQRGMVGQIPILGVLMIVQGIVFLFASAGIAFYAFLMPQVFEQMQQDVAAQGGNAAAMPPNVGPILMLVGGLFAFIMLTIAIATILAGCWRSQCSVSAWFRS